MQPLSTRAFFFTCGVVMLVVFLSVLSGQPAQARSLGYDQVPCTEPEGTHSDPQSSEELACLWARQMARRFQVTGKVYDAVTGQGIAGASVRYNNCYSHPMISPTGFDGSYEIGWTAYLMCIYSFEISSPGYQTQVQPVTFWNLLLSPRRDFHLMPSATLPPTPTPTWIPSGSPTPTPYATLISTPTPYGSLTPTPTPYASPTPYEWPTPTPYVSITPTPYEWPTPTPYESLTPTPLGPTPTPTAYEWPTPPPTPTPCKSMGCQFSSRLKPLTR